MRHAEWIVVADHGHARIFAHDHPQSGAGLLLVHEMNLGTEGQERHNFAAEVVDYLAERYRAGKFRTLILIASPPILDDIRQHLGGELLMSVRAELKKDLSDVSAADVAGFVADLAGV